MPALGALCRSQEIRPGTKAILGFLPSAKVPLPAFSSAPKSLSRLSPKRPDGGAEKEIGPVFRSSVCVSAGFSLRWQSHFRVNSRPQSRSPVFSPLRPSLHRSFTIYFSILYGAHPFCFSCWRILPNLEQTAIIRGIHPALNASAQNAPASNTQRFTDAPFLSISNQPSKRPFPGFSPQRQSLFPGFPPLCAPHCIALFPSVFRFCMGHIRSVLAVGEFSRTWNKLPS